MSLTPKMLEALHLLVERGDRGVAFLAPGEETQADPYTVFLNIQTARALRKERLVIWGPGRGFEVTAKGRRMLTEFLR